MENQLFLPKWTDVLIQIYKTPEHRRYCQRLNRDVKASINHLRAIVKLLEKANLIEVVPTKKINKINITEKGKEIVNNIVNIQTQLK